MDKWKFLCRHAAASLAGLTGLFLSQPGLALRLLCLRARYFLTRKLADELETPGGFRIDTPDMLIAYWSMFVEQELHHAIWIRDLQAEPGPVVLDVGANAGAFSHLVHTLNPKAEIVCFEPLPAMVKRIEALAKRSHANIVCKQSAISSRSGDALFESPEGHEGTSRLAAPGEKGDHLIKVKTTTLDRTAPKGPITLIKIDVEGFECDVIAGGKKTIERARHLIIEAQSAGHLAKITDALGRGWHRRRLGASDYLFSRTESAHKW